jgi:hypothetical protein
MAMPGPLFVLLGVVAVAVGVGLVARNTGQLRRAGVFGGVFWSSFRDFGPYRRRSLRPLWGWLLGLLLLLGGLAGVYLGLTAFYFSRFGTFS